MSGATAPDDQMIAVIDKLLVEILALDAGKIEPDAMLADDLGADSLDCVELQFELEDRFAISVPDDALRLSMRVSDLHQLVRDRIVA